MTERRQYPRADVTAHAIVLVRHNAGVAFVIASLSLGGARLVGPLTFDVGERVEVLFEVDGTPVDVEGTVVRVERQDMVNDRVVVAFMRLSDTAHALIHRLVVRAMNERGEREPDG